MYKPEFYISKEEFYFYNKLYTVYCTQHVPDYTRKYTYEVVTEETTPSVIRRAILSQGYNHRAIPKTLWDRRTKNGTKLCGDLFRGWFTIAKNESHTTIEVEIPYDD